MRRRLQRLVPLEKDEQAEIVELLDLLRAKVYVLGTIRKKGDHPGTMQTPGVSDLIAFLRVRDLSCQRRRLVFIEVKRKHGGRFSPAQREFQEMCAEAGIDYIGGSFDDVISWLSAHSFIDAVSGKASTSATKLPTIAPSGSIDKKDRSISIDRKDRSIKTLTHRAGPGGCNAVENGGGGDAREKVAARGVRNVGDRGREGTK